MIAITAGWEGDLAISPSGDIATSPVQVEIRQRVIRRLLTNSGAYVWHKDYGAGLGSYVGEPYVPQVIEAIVLNQLLYESLVTVDPPPAIQAIQSATGPFATASIAIRFQVAGTPASTSITLGGGG